MGLDNPLPCFFGFYSGNYILTNAVLFRNFVLSSTVCANKSNFFFIKFCRWVFGSFICSVLFGGILHILRSVSPLKIVNMVVCSASVFMTTVIFARHRAFKCVQNKPMNRKFFSYIVFAKCDKKVSVGANKRLKYSANGNAFGASNTLNSAKIRNFINRFKVENWLPNFIHTNLSLYVRSI